MLNLLLIAACFAGAPDPVAPADPAAGEPGEPGATVAPSSAEEAAKHAKFEQLRGEMERMAMRNAWGGVETAWTEMVALGVAIPPETRLMAADSARIRGDAWSAYQRLADVLRLAPETDGVAGQMQIYRDGWGRVTVRRVEATAIKLEAAELPLMPEGRAAVEFAQKQLKTTGGFDGMLPAGEYTVGTYAISVKPSLEPIVVQRVLGDGG